MTLSDISNDAYGPDFYRGNFFNDGPVPIAKVLSDARIQFIILKYSQGVSYPDWASPQAPAIRASRAALGGYHMLDGTSGTGAQQAAFFLSRYNPQPGDIVPVMDFEASGRGSASIDTYRQKGEDFIQAIHDAGFEAMIYGHADVKAAWSDWRNSGADYWWQPGSQIHNDIGPVGPDLWQYGPYTAPAGFPTDPLGNGQRADMSVVLTQLPLIGDDMAILTDDQQKYLQGLIRRFNQAGPPDAGTDPKIVEGFNETKAALDFAAANPKPSPNDGVSQAAFNKHYHDSANKTSPPRLAP